MFRSSELIEEVKRKPSLWHSAYKLSSDKDLRAMHWSEVAETLFPDWFMLSATDRNGRILEIKRKWKNIRDYHRKGTKNFNGKKYMFSHLLEFLDEECAAENISCSIKTNEIDISSITVDQPSFFKPQESEIQINNQDQESMPSGSEDLSNQDFKTVEETIVAASEVTSLKAQQQPIPSGASGSKRSLEDASDRRDEESVHLKKRRENNYDECDNDADKHFLLSLLPEMRNLTGLQKMDFKITVLKELKTVRYRQQYFVIKEEPNL